MVNYLSEYKENATSRKQKKQNTNFHKKEDTFYWVLKSFLRATLQLLQYICCTQKYHFFHNWGFHVKPIRV